MEEEEVEDMEEEEVEDMGEEVEDMEEVTELEEEAILVTEVEDMEEAMVVATIMTDTMVVVTTQKEVREVEDTIPREAAEALLIKKLGNCGYWNIHFSHSKKECQRMWKHSCRFVSHIICEGGIFS